MCGRFTLTVAPTGLGDLFGVTWSSPFKPRYNIAPGQTILALRPNPAGHEFTNLRWGLIPSWAKDEKIAWRTINARSETVDTTPSFRSAFRDRRCLIPADGYYEWQPAGDSKQPWHIRRPDRDLMIFAGLWEEWQGPNGIQATCSILTTAAEPALAHIHDRMPVILPPAASRRWLDPEMRDAAVLKDLLATSNRTHLVGTPVSTLVNNPRNDLPECLAAAENAHI